MTRLGAPDEGQTGGKPNLSSWQKERLSQGEGWQVGPVEPEVTTGEAPRRGGTLEGSVNEKPFSDKPVRPISWYLKQAELAQKFLADKNKIELNFPNTSKQNIVRTIEKIATFRDLHEGYVAINEPVSDRNFDRMAKDLIANAGDVYGKTGALQALLAYERYLETAKVLGEGDYQIRLTMVPGYRHKVPQKVAKSKTTTVRKKSTPTYTEVDVYSKPGVPSGPDADEFLKAQQARKGYFGPPE